VAVQALTPTPASSTPCALLVSLLAFSHLPDMSYTYVLSVAGDIVAAASAPSFDRLGSVILALCERRAHDDTFCDIDPTMKSVLDQARDARPSGTVQFDLVEVDEQDGSEITRATAQVRALPQNRLI